MLSAEEQTSGILPSGASSDALDGQRAMGEACSLASLPNPPPPRPESLPTLSSCEHGGRALIHRESHVRRSDLSLPRLLAQSPLPLLSWLGARTCSMGIAPMLICCCFAAAIVRRARTKRRRDDAMTSRREKGMRRAAARARRGGCDGITPEEKDKPTPRHSPHRASCISQMSQGPKRPCSMPPSRPAFSTCFPPSLCPR